MSFQKKSIMQLFFCYCKNYKLTLILHILSLTLQETAWGRAELTKLQEYTNSFYSTTKAFQLLKKEKKIYENTRTIVLSADREIEISLDIDWGSKGEIIAFVPCSLKL